MSSQQKRAKCRNTLVRGRESWHDKEVDQRMNSFPGLEIDKVSVES